MLSERLREMVSRLEQLPADDQDRMADRSPPNSKKRVAGRMP